MWLGAADAGGAGDALILAVWAFLGIVVTTLGTIAVQGLKGKSERTTSSPPPPVDASLLVKLAERTAVHDRRIDDSDERDDYQDKALKTYGDRVEALERYNDHRDPDWRR